MTLCTIDDDIIWLYAVVSQGCLLQLRVPLPPNTNCETGETLPNSPHRIRVSLPILKKTIVSDAWLLNKQLPKMSQHAMCLITSVN